jgi:hypothetical protein
MYAVLLDEINMPRLISMTSFGPKTVPPILSSPSTMADFLEKVSSNKHFGGTLTKYKFKVSTVFKKM